VNVHDDCPEAALAIAAMHEKVCQLIPELVARANAGHVAAGDALLEIGIALLEDPSMELNFELRQGIAQVLRRLRANPKAPGLQAYAPRLDGGRRPAYSDDLAATFMLEHIKFMGCAFARTAKSQYHLKADAAFDRAAEMLTEHGLVAPRTGKPYSGATVRDWFYESGQTFHSPNCDTLNE